MRTKDSRDMKDVQGIRFTKDEADAKEEKEARAKIVRQIKPKRSFDYSHITTAKGIPVASLTGIPSWLDLLTDCEAAIA